MTNRERIDLLGDRHDLSQEDWTVLLGTYTPEDRAYAARHARALAQAQFGQTIYIRGIVEFSNHCKNDCLYCGIRRSNPNACRYRLTTEEILGACDQGYASGFRTFVLQSGEDVYFDDGRMAEIVSAIRAAHPDCAITLSLGERSRGSYQRLFDAGADRYLLRHETADEAHYHKLHPPELSWWRRMDCLRILKDIGYQTGCGMMLGAPFQTPAELARDMVFLGEFRPHMIGTGPFVPHRDTPFRAQPPGSLDLTLFVLSLCRIQQPDVLLPATTALGTIHPQGRELGILAGANVIMPNLSPLAVRKQYLLYDNKVGTDCAPDLARQDLETRMAAIGYTISCCRGDWKENAL